MSDDTTGTTDAGSITLDPSQAWLVRDMLMTGLACYGQLEKLVELDAILGDKTPEAMRPIEPTGDAETTEKFAEALMYMHGRRPEAN